MLLRTAPVPPEGDERAADDASRPEDRQRDAVALLEASYGSGEEDDAQDHRDASYGTDTVQPSAAEALRPSVKVSERGHTDGRYRHLSAAAVSEAARDSRTCPNKESRNDSTVGFENNHLDGGIGRAQRVEVYQRRLGIREQVTSVPEVLHPARVDGGHLAGRTLRLDDTACS